MVMDLQMDLLGKNILFNDIHLRYFVAYSNVIILMKSITLIIFLTIYLK